MRPCLHIAKKHLLTTSLILSFLLLCHTLKTPSPKVDLGYATHTSGTKVFLYNNIRFAQPPTGDRRFRKPVTPPPHKPGVLNGRNHLLKSDCVNSAPREMLVSELNRTTWGQEDCLFLNVLVPEGVYPGIDTAPVIH